MRRVWQRWYVLGAYVPPNEAPTVARIDQALEQAYRGVEVILLGDLNIRLQ